MKPFDLEAAKRGEPLITRDGRPAKFLAHFPQNDSDYRVLALLDHRHRVYSYCEDGLYAGGATGPDDLFMAPRKVVKWGRVRLFDGERWGMDTSRLYDTHDEAHVNSDCCRTIRMEFEE